MRPVRRQRSLNGVARIRSGNLLLSSGTLLLCGCLVWGCASPGPPRPPSLFAPRPVTDLAATRLGDGVELRFTVSSLSTDGQPLRAHSLTGALCRQDAEGAPCRPVDAAQTVQPIPVPGPGGAPAVLWTDTLPPALQSGSPRPIVYRVELKTPTGRSAGFSDPVYTAAGTGPPPVGNFRGEGTRLGVALRWAPVAGVGEILLRRTGPEKGTSTSRTLQKTPPGGEVAPLAKAREHGRASHGGSHPVPPKRISADRGTVLLQAAPGAAAAAATIDNSIEPGVPYRYTAIRREQVQVGGRTLTLESRPSAEVAITWRDIYPPAAPSGLTALGYDLTAGGPQKSSGYAVDLVWEPVEDGQLVGYLIYRQTLDAVQGAEPVQGQTPAQPAAAAAVQLTPEPVATPGFHDATALLGRRYRYSVVAVGSNGQRSRAITAVVEPHRLP